MVSWKQKSRPAAKGHANRSKLCSSLSSDSHRHPSRNPESPSPILHRCSSRCRCRWCWCPRRRLMPSSRPASAHSVRGASSWSCRRCRSPTHPLPSPTPVLPSLDPLPPEPDPLPPEPDHRCRSARRLAAPERERHRSRCASRRRDPSTEPRRPPRDDPPLAAAARGVPDCRRRSPARDAPDRSRCPAASDAPARPCGRAGWVTNSRPTPGRPGQRAPPHRGDGGAAATRGVDPVTGVAQPRRRVVTGGGESGGGDRTGRSHHPELGRRPRRRPRPRWRARARAARTRPILRRRPASE